MKQKSKLTLRDSPEYTSPESYLSDKSPTPILMNILPLAAMIKKKNYNLPHQNEDNLETNSNASSDYRLSPLMEGKGLKPSLRKIKQTQNSQVTEAKVGAQSARIIKKKAETGQINASSLYRSPRTLQMQVRQNKDENIAKTQIKLEELKALTGRLKKRESKKSLREQSVTQATEVQKQKQEELPSITNLNTEMEEYGSESKKQKRGFESERGSSTIARFEINSLNLDAITSSVSRKDRIQELLKGNARERYLDKRKEDFIQFMQQHSQKQLQHKIRDSSLSKDPLLSRKHSIFRDKSSLSLDSSSNMSSRVNIGSIKLPFIKSGRGTEVQRINWDGVPRILPKSKGYELLKESLQDGKSIHELSSRIKLKSPKLSKPVKQVKSGMDRKEQLERKLEQDRKFLASYEMKSPIKQLQSRHKAIQDLLKIEKRQISSIKRFGSLADPYSERDIQPGKSIADIEKMLFESKIRNGSMRKAVRHAMGNSLDQMESRKQKRKERVSLGQDSQGGLGQQQFKYQKISRKPGQYFNLGIVEKNMEMLDRALPNFSSIY